MIGRLKDFLRGRQTTPGPVSSGMTELLSPSWARILGIPINSAAASPVTEQEALAIPTMFACVKRLSEDVGRHSFYAARQIGHDEFVPEWSHPINRILNWKANPEMSAYSFHEAMVYNAILRRNAYAEIASTDRRKVAALYPLPTHQVEFRRDEKTRKLEYRFNNGVSGYTVLKRESVLHIHGLSDDGLSGVDWMTLHAGSTLAFSSLMNKMATAIFRNDGRPSGVMMPPDNFTADPKQLKELEDAWLKRYAGEKKGRVAFSPPGFKYQQMSMDFDSAQLAELMTLAPAQICALFSVPPSWAGQPAKDGAAASKDEITVYNVNGLGPWRARLEGEFTRLVEDDDLVVIADEWELTRGDYATRTEATSKYIRSGVLTRNEARVREGLARIQEDAMDQPSIEWNAIPANKVAEVMDARIAKDKGAGGPLDVANNPRDSKNVRRVVHAFTSIAQAQVRGLIRRERDRLNKSRGADYAKHAADVLDKQEEEARSNLTPVLESLAGVAETLGVACDHKALIETAAGFHTKESRAKVIEQYQTPWTDEQVDAEAKRRSALMMDEVAVLLTKEND